MDFYDELRVEGIKPDGTEVVWRAKWFDSLRTQKRHMFRHVGELAEWRLIWREFNPRIKDEYETVMAETRKDTPGTMARLMREQREANPDATG